MRQILSGKMSHHLDPEIRKCWQGVCTGRRIPCFILFHALLSLKYNSTQLSVAEIEFEFQWQINNGIEWSVKFSFIYKPFSNISLIFGPT